MTRPWTRTQPLMLGIVFMFTGAPCHAQGFVNVYEIPHNVSANVIGNVLTHEILNRTIHHWDQDTAKKKAAAAKAAEGSLPPSAGVAGLLARDLPKDQARAGEAAYRQAYGFHEQVIKKFGLPSGDLGVGIASCIAGAWMAFHNKPFPDEFYLPLVRQMRERIASSASTGSAQLSAAETRTAYEGLAIAGMILASSQISWQRDPRAPGADALKARMRAEGGETLSRMLHAPPGRVSIGPAGVQVMPGAAVGETPAEMPVASRP